MTINSFNLPHILEKLTGSNDWQELQGPNSGCGLDYWFKSGDSEAYINIDQDHCTISVDDSPVFSGSVQNFPEAD